MWHKAQRAIQSTPRKRSSMSRATQSHRQLAFKSPWFLVSVAWNAMRIIGLHSQRVLGFRCSKSPALILVWFSGKNQDHWCHRLSESRCLIGVFLGYNPHFFLDDFVAIWVLLDVAVRTWVCSPQSTIVVVEPILNSPYCALLCEVSMSCLWGGSIGRKHSKQRPSMTLCFVLQ